MIFYRSDDFLRAVPHGPLHGIAEVEGISHESRLDESKTNQVRRLSRRLPGRDHRRCWGSPTGWPASTTNRSTPPPTSGSAFPIRPTRSCKGLKEDVNIEYFDRTGNFATAKDLLDRYGNLSSKLHVRVYRSGKEAAAGARRRREDHSGATVIKVNGKTGRGQEPDRRRSDRRPHPRAEGRRAHRLLRHRIGRAQPGRYAALKATPPSRKCWRRITIRPRPSSLPAQASKLRPKPPRPRSARRSEALRQYPAIAPSWWSAARSYNYSKPEVDAIKTYRRKRRRCAVPGASAAAHRRRRCRRQSGADGAAGKLGRHA